MFKNRWIYILLLFIVAACAKDQAPKAANTEEPDPPVNEEDTAGPLPEMKITLADPSIFYDSDSGTYYLYGTSGSAVVHSGFKVFSSTDLKDWQSHDKLALSKSDVYGTDDFWAPQVFKYENKYYMAYTANQHIAIAQSNSPLGPFKQINQQPIHDENYQNIDPYVYIDSDGKKYLYYVRLGGGNWLFVAELKDDFSDIVPGTAVSCINAVSEPQPWENVNNSTPITEGPTIIKHQGTYYFFYSANNYQSPDYAVGYATSDNPSGHWYKYEDNPVLYRAMIGKSGPGHGDLFQGKNGQYYYVFHTHYSPVEIQPRLTAIIKGGFVSDGDGKEVFQFDKDSFYYLTVKQD